MAEKQAPGVMLYFELASCLTYLSDNQCGVLLRSILNYAKDGREPDLKDTALEILWALLKPRIDADRQTYDRKVEKARAAIRSRWAQAKGEPEPGPEDTSEYERIPTYPDDIRNIPTTTTTSTTTATSTTTPTSTSSSSIFFTSSLTPGHSPEVKKPEPDIAGSGEKENREAKRRIPSTGSPGRPPPKTLTWS